MDEPIRRGDERLLKELGELLAAARESSGLSLKAVGATTGISPSHILRMESGDQDFTVTKFSRLCDALGVPAGLALESGLFHQREFFQGAGYDESPHLAMKLFGGARNEHGAVDTARLGRITTYSEAIEWLLVTTSRITAALLLSTNPDLMASHVRCPFDPVKARILSFAGRMDPLTSVAERLGVIKSLKARPYFKLKSLGILDEQIVSDYITSDAYLTSPDPGFNIQKYLLAEPEPAQPEKASATKMQGGLDISSQPGDTRGVKPKTTGRPKTLPELLNLVRNRVKERGQKAALAKYCEVSRQAVDQWLSGGAKPSADVTFKLLAWLDEPA